MKIKYEIDNSLQENEIIIKTKQLSDKILEIDRLLSSDTVDSVIGIIDKKYFPIKTRTIERIFSENRKVFLYSKSELYETKKTLTEFEVILDPSFVRISKSEIANSKLIKSIETEYSGNFTLIFVSGNKSILSRKYVKRLKSAIGLEG